MPFVMNGTFDQGTFKAACHRRAMTAAIVAMGEPFKATLITEHSAAFPERESQCYVQFFVSTESRTCQALKENRHFSLSLLARRQLAFAKRVYGGMAARRDFEHVGDIPFVSKAASVLLCTVTDRVRIGVNQQVVGHVFDAFFPTEAIRPLVNFERSYCSVNNERHRAEIEGVANFRLDD